MKVLYICFILKDIFSKVISIILPLRLLYHLCATESTGFHWLLLSLQNFSSLRWVLKNRFQCVVSVFKQYLLSCKYWRKEVMGYCRHSYKQGCSPPEELNKSSIVKRWRKKLHFTPFADSFQFVAATGVWQR